MWSYFSSWVLTGHTLLQLPPALSSSHCLQTSGRSFSGIRKEWNTQNMFPWRTDFCRYTALQLGSTEATWKCSTHFQLVCLTFSHVLQKQPAHSWKLKRSSWLHIFEVWNGLWHVHIYTYIYSYNFHQPYQSFHMSSHPFSFCGDFLLAWHISRTISRTTDRLLQSEEVISFWKSRCWEHLGTSTHVSNSQPSPQLNPPPPHKKKQVTPHSLTVHYKPSNPQPAMGIFPAARLQEDKPADPHPQWHPNQRLQTVPTCTSRRCPPGGTTVRKNPSHLDPGRRRSCCKNEYFQEGKQILDQNLRLLKPAQRFFVRRRDESLAAARFVRLRKPGRRHASDIGRCRMMVTKMSFTLNFATMSIVFAEICASVLDTTMFQPLPHFCWIALSSCLAMPDSDNPEPTASPTSFLM